MREEGIHTYLLADTSSWRQMLVGSRKPSGIRFTEAIIFARMNEPNREMSEGAENALAYLSWSLNVPELADQRK